jgi:predicted transcriptional regulator
MTPVFARVEVAGRAAQRFRTYAIAQPVRPAAFGTVPVFEAAMLILPEDPATAVQGAPVEIGPGCRICMRDSCAARREPSILSAAE